MQVSTLIDVPDPPPLNAPGPFEQHVLTQPAPLAVGLAVLAFVLSHVSRRLQPPRSRAVLASAAVCILLAGAAILSGWLIETPRERMHDAARTLVADVATANIEGVRAGLTDDCMLRYFDAPMGLPAQGILDRVSQQFKAGGVYALEEHRVRVVQAVEDRPGLGRVQIKVWAKARAGYPINSWWRIDYRKGQDDRWRASAITPVSFSGMNNPGGSTP